ncbi:MAG: transposase [Gammaproteobacteria bacterium]|nr:transposase [Gammaproteobacteria bacterium]MBU1602461.1 transposase [Gammaproteobacteria bacterium]MBU2433266.1 transposase [Gammaproteobacteria bacterium]MBU2451182.1 transposase [Gammaproteobacteria bacterium]
MLIGTRLVAPEGFGSLPKDVAYHFLSNHQASDRVMLVRFSWSGKGTPAAQLISLVRSEFEAAVVGKEIVPTEIQPTLPPWLESLKGENLGARDSNRLRGRKIGSESAKGKRLHADRIDQRLLYIARALEDMPKILLADDVEGAINQYARQAIPPQNETRFRLWLLTYIAFGCNYWSLLPPFHHAGHWDRKLFAPKKMGAPSKAHGKRYGFGMSEEMAKRCKEAYAKYLAIGKSMKAIYEESMRKEFRCKTLEQPSGMKVYMHPQGLPFPTLRQFRYEIGKAFGIETVQKNRYGSARHRNRLVPSKGNYSADVANLMEKTESDGYFPAELPKGYLEGSVLKPLCVVTSRDLLSGAKLGIGFSFGEERGTAYRMMLFCMAVPKDYFCRLWGIKLKAGEWANQGLPAHFKVDRGPGSSLNLVDEKVKPVVRNLVESWSGQSKATVESSHPRDVNFEGQPTYFESDYTVVALCRREIGRLVKYNHTADMSARIEIDRELAFIPPMAHALWNHYDERCRNSAIPISIDDAVRAFLTPVKLKVSKDGVFLDGRRYNSKELRKCGLLDRIARSGNGEEVFGGYMMDLCIRHVWVEVDRQLLLLDAQLKIREDDELLYMSFTELQQWNEARSQVASAFRVHELAATSDFIERFESQTGDKWQEGKRKYGSPKKGAAAHQEVMDVRQHTAQRKSL